MGVCRSCRQGKAEASSFPEFALQPDIAALLFYESFGDGQSQAGSFVGSIAVDLTEFLKNDPLILSANANSRICHRNAYKFILVCTIHGYLTTLGCEFHCVACEVVQNLFEPDSVRVNGIRGR